LDDVEFKQVPWQSSCGHRSLEWCRAKLTDTETHL
jgi:hypothetical protein